MEWGARFDFDGSLLSINVQKKGEHSWLWSYLSCVGENFMKSNRALICNFDVFIYVQDLVTWSHDILAVWQFCSLSLDQVMCVFCLPLFIILPSVMCLGSSQPTPRRFGNLTIISLRVRFGIMTPLSTGSGNIFFLPLFSEYQGKTVLTRIHGHEKWIFYRQGKFMELHVWSGQGNLNMLHSNQWNLSCALFCMDTRLSMWKCVERVAV